MNNSDQLKDRDRSFFHWWELLQLPWLILKRAVVAIAIGGLIGFTGLDHVSVYIVWAILGSLEVWLIRGEGARHPSDPQVLLVPTPVTAAVLNITHLMMVCTMWYLQHLRTS